MAREEEHAQNVGAGFTRTLQSPSRASIMSFVLHKTNFGFSDS